MDLFWFIILTTIVLRRWWVHHKPTTKDKKPIPKLNYAGATQLAEEAKIGQAQREIDIQKERDIADLKKQGYSDELIAVIIPQLNR